MSLHVWNFVDRTQHNLPAVMNTSWSLGSNLKRAKTNYRACWQWTRLRTECLYSIWVALSQWHEFKNYEKWLRLNLIANLLSKDVLIVNNAPYHNKQVNPAPTQVSYRYTVGRPSFCISECILNRIFSVLRCYDAPLEFGYFFPSYSI
jgi:hypothetical protein